MAVTGFVDRISALQHAGRAANGDGNAVRSLLRALVFGQTYRTNAGTPNSSLTPECVGDRVYDTTNSQFWVATGTTTTSWVKETGAPGAATVAAGSTLTLTQAAHDGRTILLDTAAGSTVTLPAASGSGMKFKFVVSVLATSNNHIIKVANASDTMMGIILTMDDTAANAEAYAAVAGTSDTITLNRSTTGSVTKGEWVEVEDIAANVWYVRGVVTNTGSSATQFSATVA